MSLYDFEIFAQKVKEAVEECLDDTYTVYKQRIQKNNGTEYMALQIMPEGEHCTPSIYLKPYYEEYQRDQDLDRIVQEILAFYEEHKNGLPLPLEDMHCYDYMRDKIIMRLVNYEKNKQQLLACPHIRWNDLAVTFRWMAYSDEIGIATALITKREQEAWNVSLEELYEEAKVNTPQLFPLRCDRMEEILLEHMPSGQERAAFTEEMQTLAQEEHPVQMYVMSNEQRINGATSILYDNALQQFAATHKTDCFLLPSSVHEMIVILQNGTVDPEELKNMVREANESVVSEEELLSDHVYLYQWKSQKITVY